MPTTQQYIGQDTWYEDAFTAGRVWCKKRKRTAKGSFNAESGLAKYLKSLGMEATLDMSLIGATSTMLDRYSNAKQAKAGFLDGVDAEWNAQLVKKEEN